MEGVMVGTIMSFAGDKAPAGWLPCNGAILEMKDYPRLFSVLGHRYGGQGILTFGLPDLRGRVPIGDGQGYGLSFRRTGDFLGLEQVALSEKEMPSHTHGAGEKALHVKLKCAAGDGNSDTPVGNSIAKISRTDQFSVEMPFMELKQEAGELKGKIEPGVTGSGKAHTNMQPGLVLNYFIYSGKK